jgi:peptidoglycan/LPS O-acetylase OafA/YrhL
MSVSARRKDIEGMRALAVGLVVANHAGVSWLSGGYIGVDVFFVISGFLITKLLLDEGDSQGRISLSQFWARRARRILPMSIVVTLATVVVGLFALEPGKVRELTSVALGALGFSTNFILIATSSDYLSGVTAPSPLRHMWSLAVEEQFYLLWPLVVFGFVKYFRSRWKMWLGIFGLVAGIASLLTSAFISKNHPTAAYYMPYTRFWEIAAGALLAIVGIHVQRINPWLRAMFGWLGLIGIGMAAVGFSDTTVFPGYAALLPVLSAMAVLIAADAQRGPHFLLSLEPLQALGARSYSLYLWHWPLLVLAEARFGNLNVGVKCVIVLAAIALSFVSYQYVEQPVRHQSWLSAKSRRTLLGAGSVLAVTLSSVFVLFAIAPKIDAGALALAEASIASEAGAGENSDSSTDALAVLPEVKPVNALLLGDSTLSALRWYEEGTKSIKGFTYTLDAESCRRISEWSCYGREYRTPQNVVQVLEGFSQPIDVIVLMAGYDSSPSKIADEFTKLFSVIRAKNVPVVFLTYKESLKFPAPGSRGKKSVYAEFNTALREAVAADTSGLVSIAEWNAYSAGQSSWFKSDGIHLTLKGALALGAFISTSVATATDNPCPYANAYPCAPMNNLKQSTDFITRFNVKDTNLQCYEDGESRKKTCTTDRRS